MRHRYPGVVAMGAEMPARLGIIARDEVALDPGQAHLKRLPDLRTDPSPDARPQVGDEERVGQMEIAPALPGAVEILDRASTFILHEPALLAPAALETGDEMGAELRLEDTRQDEDRGRRRRLERLARRRRMA